MPSATNPPAGGSTDIFKLSSELVDAIADLRPIEATYQGIPGHDHEWGDLGPGGADANVAKLEEFRRRHAALGEPRDRWERLAWLVMKEFLDQQLDWFAQRDHLIDLNNIASTFQGIRQVFDVMDTSTPAAWENIVSRLETIHEACEGYRTTLDEGRRSGHVVAKRQVRAAITEGRVHAGDQSFFRRLPSVFEASGIADPKLHDRLLASVNHACGSFAGLADYLEKTYLPVAKEDDAVGRERYLRNTKRFLGMDIDPVETYRWGWQQIREIEAEMKKVADAIKPGAPVGEVIELLKSDPARCAASPDEFRGIMLDRQLRALSELDGVHFDIPDPVRRIDVKLAPPGGALAAYYVPPTEDFSRPGTVWYPLGDKTIFPLYDEISTAYHEGFPGHHLQCAIQVSLSDRLSRLHRLMIWYPGYGEGWALYAEQLMKELGYFEKPDYVIGMYVGQLFRACRIVIDIGCHLKLAIPADETFHPGEVWNYALGVEMLEKRAFTHKAMAESEVTRYLGWPGQAISYKVGQRAILELRDGLKSKLGGEFNLKDFHARVVGSGPVGLELLRELVLE